MDVKNVTPDTTPAKEEPQAALMQLMRRVSEFMEERLQTGTVLYGEFTRPELCAVVDAAKSARETLFALTPTRVYLLHRGETRNGTLLAEVDDADVQESGDVTLSQ